MDIEFYLTGAVSPNAFQNMPNKSLGGFISSAMVKNGDLDGLFGGISEFNKLNKKPELVMIAMKNTGSNKSNFNIKAVNATGSYSIASIAVVNPTYDGDGNPSFESIPEKSSEPYYADFANATGVSIPVFKKNDIYGIWIKRVISPSALIPMTIDTLNAAFDANLDLEGVDDIILDINFD